MSLRFSSLLIPSALSLGAASVATAPARANETRLIEKRLTEKRPGVSLGVSLGAPSEISKNAPNMTDSRAISQREFADAATRELSLLAGLRSWRDTLRGRGARRDFGLAPRLKGEKLAFSLGGVAPLEFGGGAGVAARWNRVEIGSTAQPEALDEALARVDSYLTGTTVAPQNQTMKLNWLRAKLSESKNAQIEVSMARARRELQDSGASTNWRGGNFQQARASFKLPANWSLSGDYGRAQIEQRQIEQLIVGDSTKNEALTKNEDETLASAWGINAAGPIAHPFGVATARANWRQIDDGYATPTNPNGALGAKNGAVEIAQELKIGRLAGNLRFGANTRARAEIESALAGQELEHDQTQSAAQLKLALTPNLSFTGQGTWNSALTERALIDQNLALSTKNEIETETEIVTPAQARELSRQIAGDVGMQWNFSKALSLAVSLGTSLQSAHREIGDVLQNGPQSDEMRRALEVRRKGKNNDFRLRFSQRARRDATSNLNAASGSAISQWRIEAARPIIGNVRLKTIFDFASDGKSDQNAHRIEAQLQLARAARFDARYREGNLPSGLMSDEWSSVFQSSTSTPKQWSARFGLGSAASGAGLGLAIETARAQGNLPDSWRVGVQFK